MTYVLLLALVATSGGLFKVMRGAGKGGGASSLAARLGRYGAMAGMQGATVLPTYTKDRSEQSAVSRGVDKLVARRGFGEKLGRKLEAADLKVTPGEFVSICFSAFVVAMLAGILIRGTVGLLVLGLIGLAAPWVYLKRRTSKRRKKFIEQLADMSQMMGNSMRAGFSIIQSMELVAGEGPSPAREEFERVVTEVKLGLPLEQALEHMLGRIPSEDLGLAVVAINVQRQVGGNLAEILMVISKTVRERVRFTRELKAMTSAGRYSSYVITALPVGVAIVINFMDRPYESYLYTTLIGHLMMGVAITMVIAGFFILNRIANIEV